MAGQPEEITFEAALARLEEIVETLERGEPALAEALSSYEHGVRLLSQCYGLLSTADRSVAILKDVDLEGKPVVAAFDATATVERESASRGGTGSAEKPADVGSPTTAPAAKPVRARKTRPVDPPDSDRFDPPF